MKEILNNYINRTLTTFETVSKKPESFLSCEKSQINELKKSLKQTYDFIKTEEPANLKSNALSKLHVEDFDCEQVWQQIELQNDAILTRSLINTSRLLVKKHTLTFSSLNDDTTDGEKSNDETDENIDNEENSSIDEDECNDNKSEGELLREEESDLDSENDLESFSSNSKNSKNKNSIVDDEFFKLYEMENFLNMEDKKFEESHNKDFNNKHNEDDNEEDDESDDDEEESFDYFGVNDEDSEEDEKMKNPRFKDFFRAPNEERTVKINKTLFDLEDIDESKETEAVKSTYEIRQERLAKKIERFEDKALADRPWQLKGEITAESRPQNSLLEEFVEFDLTSRPAPIITEQTTLYLEDIIRQRIKDKAWDSVERKHKLVEAPTEYKKKLLLDQEKSKESLAQIYEKEFLKQQESLDPDAADKEEEEPKEHNEIRKFMNELFTKLDALSNFHFTPKPAIPELKIISNLPAISMEEVAPVATSDGALLAPEEVKNKTKGDELGKSERTKTDKKRDRRKKKIKQKVHAMEKKKKDDLKAQQKPGLEKKMSKIKTSKLIENVTKDRNVNKMDESRGMHSVKSSTAFFTQLQEEVQKGSKRKMDYKEKTLNNNKLNAKKIKL